MTKYLNGVKVKMKCDVCGIEYGVECEILTKGESVDRVYHLCPEHWTAVYRRTLDDFVEQNEYKANSYIKMVADKMIVDAIHTDKVELFLDEEGALDVEGLEPKEVRRLRPYTSSVSESDYE